VCGENNKSEKNFRQALLRIGVYLISVCVDCVENNIALRGGGIVIRDPTFYYLVYSGLKPFHFFDVDICMLSTSLVSCLRDQFSLAPPDTR
jgi:hypothetical protein